MASSSTPLLSKNEQNPLSDDDKELLSSQLNMDITTTSTMQRERRSLSRIGKILVAILALWGFITLSLHLAQFLYSSNLGPSAYGTTWPAVVEDVVNSSIDECDCGESTKEAEAMGCKFDPMASAWPPKECRDNELTAEFERSGPGPNGKWSYFADPDGNIPINKTQIAAMADNFDFWYLTKEWHLTHCQLLLAKTISDERYCCRDGTEE